MGYELLTLDIDLLLVTISLIAIIAIQILFVKPPEPLSRIKQKFAKRFRGAFTEFAEGFKLKKVPAKTILLSIVSIIALDILYVTLYPSGQLNTPPFSIISTTILHPIVEEFIYRGLYFGVMVLVINTGAIILHLPAEIKKPLIILPITIQAISFGIDHNATLQAFQGILLALLFIGHNKIKSKNNLLPPIIAHATHNIIITIMACC